MNTYLCVDLRALLSRPPLLLCLGEARGTQEQQHRQHPHGPAEVRPALHGGGATPPVTVATICSTAATQMDIQTGEVRPMHLDAAGLMSYNVKYAVCSFTTIKAVNRY